MRTAAIYNNRNPIDEAIYEIKELLFPKFVEKWSFHTCRDPTKCKRKLHLMVFGKYVVVNVVLKMSILSLTLGKLVVPKYPREAHIFEMNTMIMTLGFMLMVKFYFLNLMKSNYHHLMQVNKSFSYKKYIN